MRNTVKKVNVPMNPIWKMKSKKEERFPKGSPSPECVFVSQSVYLGSGLSSTHLIELIEISSSKIIMCKSLGGGIRIMDDIFYSPFLS